MESEIIKVLLIEDNRDSIEFMRGMLVEENYNKFELVCAERLSTGLESLNNGDFDVILLDMSLPDSQGIGTLIKARTHAPDVPIVVLTNLDEETFAVKAVQKGAQDYLVKGRVDSNLLVRSIRYAIERQRMLKKLEQAQLRLQRLAHYDSLTELPNRQMFYNYLNKSVARARRHAKILAVLFLDLDKFKVINDTLGHSVGDFLLQSVAKRLTSCIRESDIVARLGGDEFTVILDSVNSIHDSAKVAQTIIETLSKVFILEGNKLFITTSIGISLYPYDSYDMETLVKNADFAMYRAKEYGRNNYKFFLSNFNDELINKTN